MTNPYQTPNEVAADSGRHGWWIAWDATLVIAGVGLLFIAVDLYAAHAAEWRQTGNLREFLVGIANDWSIVAVLGLFLVGLSSAPLHRRPGWTRLIAGAVCALFAFDFPSLQFGPSHLTSGFITAVFLAPLLLFGCGFPHACLGIYRWWKRVPFKQV
ncbi:hypothetical protein [Rhodopirellula bahusiensis]|uniref:hypothetical protein n=2 Tax=Rhodopirellula bahusiensis TaxID=2014065 RepID=UPI0032664CD2